MLACNQKLIGFADALFKYKVEACEFDRGWYVGRAKCPQSPIIRTCEDRENVRLRGAVQPDCARSVRAERSSITEEAGADSAALSLLSLQPKLAFSTNDLYDTHYLFLEESSRSLEHPLSLPTTTGPAFTSVNAYNILNLIRFQPSAYDYFYESTLLSILTRA